MYVNVQYIPLESSVKCLKNKEKGENHSQKKTESVIIPLIAMFQQLQSIPLINKS